MTESDVNKTEENREPEPRRPLSKLLLGAAVASSGVLALGTSLIWGGAFLGGAAVAGLGGAAMVFFSAADERIKNGFSYLFSGLGAGAALAGAGMLAASPWLGLGALAAGSILLSSGVVATGMVNSSFGERIRKGVSAAGFGVAMLGAAAVVATPWLGLGAFTSGSILLCAGAGMALMPDLVKQKWSSFKEGFMKWDENDRISAKGAFRSPDQVHVFNNGVHGIAGTMVMHDGKSQTAGPEKRKAAPEKEIWELEDGLGFKGYPHQKGGR